MSTIPRTLVYGQSWNGPALDHAMPTTRSLSAVQPNPPLRETVEYTPALPRTVTYSVSMTKTAVDQSAITNQIALESQMRAAMNQVWQSAQTHVSFTA